jgi:DNA-binding NarL/FixJ family response regulator
MFVVVFDENLGVMRLSVLIVDDHASFRSWARALLQGDGLDVVGEAADGASAVEAARALRPDIVLLDVRLPDLNGFEVADMIAQLENAPAVVLTSSHDARDYKRRIAESPARGFISKADLSGEVLTTIAVRM